MGFLALTAGVIDRLATSGANTEEHLREQTFRGLLAWGMSMVLVAPLLSWLVFVVL